MWCTEQAITVSNMLRNAQDGEPREKIKGKKREILQNKKKTELLNLNPCPERKA